MSTFNNFYVGFSFWNKLKLRYNNTDPSIYDKSIMDIIDKLNRIPGITTIWSCSGIEEDHMFDSYMDGKQLDPDFKPRGYITFVVDKNNPHYFESLILLGLSYQSIAFKVMKLFNIFDANTLVPLTSDTRFDDNNSYYCWTIEWINRLELEQYKKFINEYINSMN